MNIFDQYGIKEVADVTLYSIHKKKDGSGEVYYVPALYLDTLKISSVEKTAENVWAQGGLGNARLICWDYGKQINVTLEDALCTPASLGLCWGGILSSDWKDAEIKHDYGISFNNNNPVERLSRMEKAFYPRNDRENGVIGKLIPLSKEDKIENYKISGLPVRSSIIDGVKIEGFGYVHNHSYKWKMKIESGAKSIGVIPNKIFDHKGKFYNVDTSKIIITEMPSQSTSGEYKFSVIYRINKISDETKIYNEQIIILKENDVSSILNDTEVKLKNATFLKIIVDNNNFYTAKITNDDLDSKTPTEIVNSTNWVDNDEVDLEQFKGIDMWLKFNGMNELTYFLLTKYQDNIFYIGTKTIEKDIYKLEKNDIDDDIADDVEVEKELEGKLWSYVNPKTMIPYDDDYWFSQGEPYYVKSLTLAPKNKKLKSQKIIVTAGQFPGMYMLVGETYIRSRDTGEDERMQIKIPLCKVKSDQNLTLEAEGEPTVFNMDIEVARPVNGIMMELTSYEVAEKMQVNEQGFVESKDGSTEVLSE